jgi:hypothetical protein
VLENQAFVGGEEDELVEGKGDEHAEHNGREEGAIGDLRLGGAWSTVTARDYVGSRLGIVRLATVCDGYQEWGRSGRVALPRVSAVQ